MARLAKRGIELDEVTPRPEISIHQEVLDRMLSLQFLEAATASGEITIGAR